MTGARLGSSLGDVGRSARRALHCSTRTSQASTSSLIRVRASSALWRDAEYADTLRWTGGVFDPKGFDLNRLNRDWRPGRRA